MTRTPSGWWIATGREAFHEPANSDRKGRRDPPRPTGDGRPVSRRRPAQPLGDRPVAGPFGALGPGDVPSLAVLPERHIRRRTEHARIPSVDWRRPVFQLSAAFPPVLAGQSLEPDRCGVAG